MALARGVSAADISPKEMVVGLAMVAARYATAFASGALLAAFRWWLPIVLLITYLW